jgi:hypothetical protein
MDRRESIRKLMMASGALIALPSWAAEWTKEGLNSIQSGFTVTEQELLSGVADTIIPAGDSIGARSVGVDKFLLKLLSDCYEKEVQDNVKTQLTALDESAKKSWSRSFTACDQAQRQELLLKMASSENKSESEFFKLMKSETIRGFNTSREVMMNYLNYKPVPGHYYGCVDVKA